MPRKTIQKNLAYDTERQLYYAVFRQDGRRYTAPTAPGRRPRPRWRGTPVPTGACREGLHTGGVADLLAGGGGGPGPGGEHAVRLPQHGTLSCAACPGKDPLAELTPLRIQGYLYEKMNQGLSPNTVIKHYVMLTTALGMAVRLEMLERSPMDRVTPPKKRRPASAFTPRALQALFSAVSGTMMELPVKLAAYLGLRRQRDLRPAVGECGPGGGAALHPGGAHRGGRRRGAEVPQDPHLRPAAGHHRAPGPAAGAAGRAWERRRSDDPKEWVVLRQDGAPPSRTS